MPDTDANERDVRAVLRELLSDLRQFPWRNTALTLRERFRQDRLGLAASSLTFSTIIALVPLFTVALAIFSALPEFELLARKLEQWLVRSLIPENIARTVLAYLRQFSAKAAGLGWGGGAVLLASAFAVVLTVDGKFNDIWRVHRQRQLHRRLLMYWAGLTLGPLLLALSLSLSTTVLSNGLQLLGVAGAGRLRWPGAIAEFALMTAALAALYRIVPNTSVRWAHALLGALLAGFALALAKRLLGWYLSSVPSYSVIYGAFATVPILLIWIYLMWVVVLLGAVVTAYLPVLLRGVSRRPSGCGWDFQLALEVLAMLRWARDQTDRRGLSLAEMARRASVADRHLHPAVEALLQLNWVAVVDEPQARCVLLVDVQRTLLGDLLASLLLPRTASLQPFWQRAKLADATLAEVLPTYQPETSAAAA